MSIWDTLNDEDQDTGGKPVNGIVTGLVTRNDDPDNQGRVQVNINTLEDGHVTKWASVATLMAGPGRGSLFLPEVDDEVLVAFEHGNINAPYVVGSIWNGASQPPGAEDGGGKGNNIRKIRSRSGHEILFDDDSEGKKEKLAIKTNGGHTIVLDDAAGKEKIEIVDKTGSNKMVIDSVKNSVDIESAGQLNIKANMIKIEAAGTLTVKSGAVLTIQGSLVKIN